MRGLFGERVRAATRRLLRRAPARTSIVEAAGVAVFAYGAGTAWEPAGVMIVGTYIVLLANMATDTAARTRRERDDE